MNPEFPDFDRDLYESISNKNFDLNLFEYETDKKQTKERSYSFSIFNSPDQQEDSFEQRIKRENSYKTPLKIQWTYSHLVKDFRTIQKKRSNSYVKQKIQKYNEPVQDQVQVSALVNKGFFAGIYFCSCSINNCWNENCPCFGADKGCNEQCICENCQNLNSIEVDFKRQVAKEELRRKIQKIQNPQFRKEQNKKIIEINNNKVYQKGCYCFFKCEDKKCKCFKNNMRCSEFCFCISCTNNKLQLDKRHLKKIDKKLVKKAKPEPQAEKDIQKENLERVKFKYKKNLKKMLLWNK